MSSEWHEFDEDVDDASMCVCGVPAPTHDQVFDPGYPRSRDFLQAVSAILLAGDIQAKVVSNAEHCFIEVSLVDGTKVFWSNSREFWGYTVVSQTGDAQGDYETLPWDVEAVDAAKMIAMHDYPAPAEWPQGQPGMREFSDLPGVFTTVLPDGVITALNTRGDDWDVKCPICHGGEDQATCGHCAGRGHVDHVPYPNHRWDEVAPRLYVGGHSSQEEHIVRVGSEFDLVVSLHQEPEGVSVYGPDPGVEHLTHTMRDADLDPEHHGPLDVLSTRVQEVLADGDTVLVRCMGGINRSSLVAALAMVKIGWDPDAAIEAIRRARSPYCLFNESFVSYILGESVAVKESVRYSKDS